MITISKKRIRNLYNYLPKSLYKKQLVFTADIGRHNEGYLEFLGFEMPLENGHTILPAPIGSISRMNADGKSIPIKDQPKETRYRDVEFTRTEWRGNGETEEVTSNVWVPYKRYQRLSIPPVNVELSIFENSIGQILVKTPNIVWENNDEIIIHTINLLLELFGDCYVFEENNEIEIITLEKQVLNWEIFPTGEYPWETVKEVISKNKRKQAKRSYRAAMQRFKFIHSFEPNFYASGRGGYSGYVVFGFDKKFFILESQYSDNATYIFNNQWEELSKLTKKEIISDELQKARFIHNPKWEKNINEFINNEVRNHG